MFGQVLEWFNSLFGNKSGKIKSKPDLTMSVEELLDNSSQIRSEAETKGFTGEPPESGIKISSNDLLPDSIEPEDATNTTASIADSDEESQEQYEDADEIARALKIGVLPENMGIYLRHGKELYETRILLFAELLLKGALDQIVKNGTPEDINKATLLRRNPAGFAFDKFIYYTFCADEETIKKRKHELSMQHMQSVFADKPLSYSDVLRQYELFALVYGPSLRELLKRPDFDKELWSLSDNFFDAGVSVAVLRGYAEAESYAMEAFEGGEKHARTSTASKGGKTKNAPNRELEERGIELYWKLLPIKRWQSNNEAARALSKEIYPLSIALKINKEINLEAEPNEEARREKKLERDADINRLIDWLAEKISKVNKEELSKYDTENAQGFKKWAEGRYLELLPEKKWDNNYEPAREMEDEAFEHAKLMYSEIPKGILYLFLKSIIEKIPKAIKEKIIKP